MKKVTITLAAVVMGLALFAGSVAAQPTTIGVNLELSGRFVAIGTSTLQGIEAALEQMGDSTSFVLSICDNATSVEGSVACANRFVDEGVTAVLGPISSSMAIPAAEVLQSNGVIMISTSSTNDATTQIGEYIFRMAYLDSFQGPVLARFAYNDLSAQRVIVFRQQDDDYSFGLAGFFSDELVALGGEVLTVDYVANTVDFSAQINDILGEPADAIFFSGFCAEGASLVPSIKAAGITLPIFAADATDDSQCPLGGGEAFDGFLFSGFAGPEVLGGEVGQRASEFGAFFRVLFPDAADFNGFTLAGADSMNVIAEAVRTAATSDATVLDALSDLEGYPGVSGVVTFRGTDGSPAERIIGIYEYQVPGPDGQPFASRALFSVGNFD
jgi:branched-chain amino acid transport system substrate-binding protein